MDWTHARERFAFLAEALDGGGGFAPRVSWYAEALTDSAGAVTTKQTPRLNGPTHLVRYQRETEQRFAARNAIAVYENHLSSAVARFCGFLGRRSPARDGVDAPLVRLMIEDADLRGTSLDTFWSGFAAQAKARGSMLLVIDMPDGPAPSNLAEQQRRRAVPYLRWASPESVVDFRIDADSGEFLRVTLASKEWVDDELTDVERDYDATTWRLRKDKTVLKEGVHGFGACPVMAFTENGTEFPRVGEYAQVADISRRIFNTRSEQDEILRGQTFSLLTLQVPPEHAANFDGNTVAATVGVHSMLIHTGDTPAYIAPDSGPAATFAAKLEELQQAIRRVTMESSTESSSQAESGVARRMRFEALNASVATFAKQLQAIERRMWAMWHRAMGTTNGVQVSWPTDYNLADVLAELDILTLMQATGMPTAVLNEKRKAIVDIEFDAAGEATKAALHAAIDEIEQEQVGPAPIDPEDKGPTPWP